MSDENEVGIGDEVAFEWDFGDPDTPKAWVKGDLVDIGASETCYIKVNKSNSNEFTPGKVYAVPDDCLRRPDE